MAKVKICGITNLKDAQAAVSLGANALGFIFWKKSPRYVKPEVAKAIIKYLPERITKVGVFVDEKVVHVKKIASYCGLNALQFHGQESKNYCQRFRGYRIIKAFRIKDRINERSISGYKVDAFLFDTYLENAPGGTGKTFDWNLLKELKKIKTPIILSGGINPKNVKRAIELVSPYAIDAASSLEKQPGKKDYKLMQAFFKAIKE